MKFCITGVSSEVVVSYASTICEEFEKGKRGGESGWKWALKADGDNDSSSLKKTRSPARNSTSAATTALTVTTTTSTAAIALLTVTGTVLTLTPGVGISGSGGDATARRGEESRRSEFRGYPETTRGLSALYVATLQRWEFASRGTGRPGTGILARFWITLVRFVSVRFGAMDLRAGPHGPLALLLAALLNALRVPALNVTDSVSSGASIQRTYELTKYLEHQLRAVTGAYLSYLGPPFNDPDFSAPRPNSSEPSLPSATTRLDIWKGMGNLQRLSENQRAYSLLLGAVRGLAEGTLCPSLQRSLHHLCTGLQGLLISIAGVMSGLGYPLPPSIAPAGHLKPSALLPSLGDYSGFGEVIVTERPLLFRHAASGNPAPFSSSPPSGPAPSRTGPASLYARPASDFSRKMADFWVLRELQTWLWRSAKDFNRLKKRLAVQKRRS
ncbi:uncharacterized protein clcf1 [Polyodon spathula]|uniref:uncharacterized protein clcf1 n=1 Tax=Polyodon spathula TaxID=7913 RepID=UPI001B7E4FAD|nr:uncharacterized protein clcf1 [Polyodon spathula]